MLTCTFSGPDKPTREHFKRIVYIRNILFAQMLNCHSYWTWNEWSISCKRVWTWDSTDWISKGLIWVSDFNPTCNLHGYLSVHQSRALGFAHISGCMRDCTEESRIRESLVQVAHHCEQTQNTAICFTDICARFMSEIKHLSTALIASSIVLCKP